MKVTKIICGAGLIAALGFAQNYRAWTDNGGGPDNSHYSALTQITKANVGQIQPAWSYPTGRRGVHVQSARCRQHHVRAGAE